MLYDALNGSEQQSSRVGKYAILSLKIRKYAKLTVRVNVGRKAMLSVKNIFLPQKEISDFCQRWQISEIALFGSVLRDDFGPDSDLDILVTFAPEADWSLFDHVRMQEELSHLLNREIDLLSRRAVEHSHNNLRRQEILNTAQVVYVSG